MSSVLQKLQQHRTILTAIALSVAVCCPSIASSEQKSANSIPANKAQIHAAQDAWFQANHRSPDKRTPAEHRLNALNQLKKLPTIVPESRGAYSSIQRADQAQSGLYQSMSLDANTLGGAWTPIGPSSINSNLSYGKVSGRVTSLAVDTVHDPSGNTIYVGAAYGGVWKSTNAKSASPTYTPLTDTTASLAVGSLALDTSTTPATIYVGTGEANFTADCYYGVGILKSTDGGATWTLATGANGGALPFFGLAFSRILVDPVNTHILLASATQGSGLGYFSSPTGTLGIYRSTDSGATWSLAYNPGLPVTDMAYDSTRHQYIAAVQDNGFYKSTDQGATWSALATPFSGGVAVSSSNFTRASLTTRAGTIWALISEPDQNLSRPNPAIDTGIVQSTDGGQSWAPIAAPDVFPEPQAIFDQYIAAPASGTSLVVAGNDIYYTASVNGSSTAWTNVTNTFSGNTYIVGPVHTDQHAIAFLDPNQWYVANDGGVWYTANAGTNWTDLNTNLNISQFYSVTPDPFTAGTYLGGTQDNGTETAAGGNLQWNQFFGADGGYTDVNPNIAQQYFFSTFGIGIYRTSDGGATVQTVIDSNHISGITYKVFLLPYQVKPSDPTQMILGTNPIWGGAVNATLGAGWGPISPQLGSPADLINVVAGAPSEVNVIYAGGNHVWRRDFNATWGDVTPTISFDSIAAIAVHPTDYNTVYLGLPGFHGVHVLKSTNGGASWTDITGNMPNAPVNSIVIDPLFPSNVYVGTDIGVFVITDGGNGGGSEVWSQLGTNLPNSATLQVKIAPTSPRAIVAATHGRGAWTISALTSSAPVITSSGTAGGTLNTAFSYQITASNSPTSYGATPLPAGLSVNTGTGLISGTPTALGTTNTVVSATNSAGTGTKTVVITIGSNFNVNAIYTSGTPFTTGGLDNSGKAYVAGELGTSVTYNGSSFTFGAPNTPDGYSNVVVALPPGNYTTLNMVGTASGGISTSQTFTVTYTDNSTQSFTKNMSDWTSGNALTGETKVVNMPDYIASSGTVTAGRHYLSGYTLTLNGKAVKSITLPSARGVVMLGFAGASSPPVITSPLTASGTSGAAFSYTITATNSPTSFGATPLPGGLTVNTSTGVISGTPTAGGTTSTTISATNAAGTGSATLVITIATAYNVSAIYTSGQTFPSSGGLDSYGNAYLSSQLGASCTYNTSTFTFGPANTPDGWSNTTVALAPGTYTSLDMVGTSSGGISSSQTFTVNYTDGTNQAFTISMRDWTAAGFFTGETKVVTMANYAHFDGTSPAGNHVLHGYTLTLNGKSVKSITLPAARGVVMLGFKGH